MSGGSTSRGDDAAWHRLVDAASAPYAQAGRFARHFASGKLRFDPVFRHLLESGPIEPRDRVLDIGCGQGLLSSLLAAASRHAGSGAWPTAWARAPADVRVIGIERMDRDVERARRALGGVAEAAGFILGDMREVAFPDSDAIVILDVLHYVDHAAQDALLARARQALRSGGRLVLRIGDASTGLAFAASQWCDRIVTTVRGHRVAPTFCRSLDAWTALLERHAFAVASRPMHRGTPFANILLTARAA